MNKLIDSPAVPAYLLVCLQVVLVQRRACLECRREASVSTGNSTTPIPMSPLLPNEEHPGRTRLSESWDDIWGPDPGSAGDWANSCGDGLLEEEGGQEGDCGHCPSRGKTYYDPTGDDGRYFFLC